MIISRHFNDDILKKNLHAREFVAQCAQRTNVPRIDYKPEFGFSSVETGDDRARKCDSRKGQTINYPGRTR